MNERIRVLAEQAGFMEAWFSESGDDCEREITKLAELIVRECASIVYKTCQDGDAGAQAILYEFDIDNARSQK